MTTILLTGKNGQMGWELRRSLSTMGKVIAVGKEDCDLQDKDKLVKLVNRVKPNLIVNCAAYTAVDKAQSEPDIAFAINATAPGILAEYAKKQGAGIIHFSTDYVFDGNKSQPYKETDPQNPLSVYGKTKLYGEAAIKDSGANYLILRLSWVYGNRGNSFYKTMLKLAKTNKELKIVNDQTGTPTPSKLIAAATSMMCYNIVVNKKQVNKIYHLAPGGQCTWYQFAKAIFEKFRGPIPNLIPITTDEYQAAAPRPKNSVLCSDAIKNDWGIQLPNWEDGLDLVMDNDVVCRGGSGTARV